MQPPETLIRRRSPREKFIDEVQELGRISQARRDELGRTREALARRIDDPSSLQLIAALEDVMRKLGQDRANAILAKVLLERLPAETALHILNEHQRQLQQLDEDPSAIR